MNFVFYLITSTSRAKTIESDYLVVSANLIMNLWLLNRKALLLHVFFVRARYFEVASLEIRKECHTCKSISKTCKFWLSIE